MSKFTDEDFLMAEELEEKVHIMMHRIRDYELDVQIPQLAQDEIPIEHLEMLRFAGEMQGGVFQNRYVGSVEDDATGQMIEGTYAPIVLLGLYEGWLMILAGVLADAVPSFVAYSYGSFMVACARPYMYIIGGCEG